MPTTPAPSAALTIPAANEIRPRASDSFVAVTPEAIALREVFVEKITLAALAGKPVTGAIALQAELDRLRKIALEAFDKRHGLTTAETSDERQRRENAEAMKKAVADLEKRRAAAERESRLAIDRLKIKIPRGLNESMSDYKARLARIITG